MPSSGQTSDTEPYVVRLYDTHNHLQDERLSGLQPALMAACRAQGVSRMVVNGACESDWPDVARLAREYPEVLPSFGYHPWYIDERLPDWESHLESLLNQRPSAVGEIGLDRWKPGLSYVGQEDVFAAQMRVAARRNVPASIHCLQAWGALHDLLRCEPRPERGFVLHSYGGPVEMIPPLADLGAYFSFPGFFLHTRKERQREAFKRVPPDRLLVETDAPDQSPPAPKDAPHEPRSRGGKSAPSSPERNQRRLTSAATFQGLKAPSVATTKLGQGAYHPLAPGPDGRPLNHPANLRLVYLGLAEVLGVKFEELAAQVERNFLRVFGGL
jgi:TatD DNase family protein